MNRGYSNRQKQRVAKQSVHSFEKGVSSNNAANVPLEQMQEIQNFITNDTGDLEVRKGIIQQYSAPHLTDENWETDYGKYVGVMEFPFRDWETIIVYEHALFAIDGENFIPITVDNADEKEVKFTINKNRFDYVYNEALSGIVMTGFDRADGTSYLYLLQKTKDAKQNKFEFIIKPVLRKQENITIEEINTNGFNTYLRKQEETHILQEDLLTTDSENIKITELAYYALADGFTWEEVKKLTLKTALEQSALLRLPAPVIGKENILIPYFRYAFDGMLFTKFEVTDQTSEFTDFIQNDKGILTDENFYKNIIDKTYLNKKVIEVSSDSTAVEIDKVMGFQLASQKKVKVIDEASNRISLLDNKKLEDRIDVYHFTAESNKKINVVLSVVKPQNFSKKTGINIQNSTSITNYPHFLNANGAEDTSKHIQLNNFVNPDYNSDYNVLELYKSNKLLTDYSFMGTKQGTLNGELNSRNDTKILTIFDTDNANNELRVSVSLTTARTINILNRQFELPLGYYTQRKPEKTGDRPSRMYDDRGRSFNITREIRNLDYFRIKEIKFLDNNGAELGKYTPKFAPWRNLDSDFWYETFDNLDGKDFEYFKQNLGKWTKGIFVPWESDQGLHNLLSLSSLTNKKEINTAVDKTIKDLASMFGGIDFTELFDGPKSTLTNVKTIEFKYSVPIISAFIGGARNWSYTNPYPGAPTSYFSEVTAIIEENLALIVPKVFIHGDSNNFDGIGYSQSISVIETLKEIPKESQIKWEIPEKIKYIQYFKGNTILYGFDFDNNLRPYNYEFFSYGKNINYFPAGRIVDIPTNVASTINKVIPYRNSMIAFTSNSIVMNTDGLYEQRSVITSSLGVSEKDRNSIQVKSNNLIFKSGKEIYAGFPVLSSGKDDNLAFRVISKGIRDKVDELDKYDIIGSQINEDEYILFGSYNDDSKGKETLCLVYSTTFKSWTTRKYDINISNIFKTTTPEIIFVDINGNSYKEHESRYDIVKFITRDLIDNSVNIEDQIFPINIRLKTGDKPWYKDFEYEKTFGDFRLVATNLSEGSEELLIKVTLDAQEYETFEEMVFGTGAILTDDGTETIGWTLEGSSLDRRGLEIIECSIDSAASNTCDIDITGNVYENININAIELNLAPEAPSYRR